MSRPLVHDVAEGIVRVPLPTPFAVGDVNCYLIEGDPLTLVDCGPNGATTLLALQQALAVKGYRLSDLELVVVTHQHIDHTGLAGVLSVMGNVEVACLDLLAPTLEDWERVSVRDDDDAERTMQNHGVEPHVSTALRAMADIARPWGRPSPVHRRFPDESVVRLGGRDWLVQHRPGHSPSDTLLVDCGSGVAIVGDHLLAKVSSNALLARPLNSTSWDGSRPKTLLTYRDSLRRTRELDVDLLLPGHGPLVVDHRELIDQRLNDQEARADRVLAILEPEPRTAHEIARVLWGDIAFKQAFLTLSEVLGHLDLLIDAGTVMEHRDDKPVRFAAASAD